MMVNDAPKVTIALVTYHHERFIEACLDSIRAQNYPHLELLISDDASTDKTAQIIEAYDRAHPGFITSFTRQAENLGISRNLNFVLAQATGAYLTPFSGDDLMLPGKIETQVRAMEQAQDAVFCFTNMEWFWSESGRKICNHFGFLQNPSTDLARVIGDFSIPTPTLMLDWRRAGHLRYDEDLKFINDFYFVIQLLLLGRAIYIPQILTRYRKHKGAVTLKNYFYDDRVRLLDKLKETLPRQYHYAIERYRYIVRYARIMTMIQNGRKREALRAIGTILPMVLTSPKWMVRFGAVLVSLLRSK